jgi:hypothetical protein
MRRSSESRRYALCLVGALPVCTAAMFAALLHAAAGMRIVA